MRKSRGKKKRIDNTRGGYKSIKTNNKGFRLTISGNNEI